MASTILLVPECWFLEVVLLQLGLLKVAASIQFIEVDVVDTLRFWLLCGRFSALL